MEKPETIINDSRDIYFSFSNIQLFLYGNYLQSGLRIKTSWKQKMITTEAPELRKH